MKKISRKLAESFIKGKYALYHKGNFIILGKYGRKGGKWYLRDLTEVVSTLLLSIFGIISFPFLMIYTLFTFIPSINIIDERIDKAEEEKKRKINKEAKEKLDLKFDEIEW